MLQQVRLLAASSQQPQHAHADTAYHQAAQRLPAAVSEDSDPQGASGLLGVDTNLAMAPTAGEVLAMAASAGVDWKVLYITSPYVSQHCVSHTELCMLFVDVKLHYVMLGCMVMTAILLSSAPVRKFDSLDEPVYPARPPVYPMQTYCAVMPHLLKSLG